MVYMSCMFDCTCALLLVLLFQDDPDRALVPCIVILAVSEVTGFQDDCTPTVLTDTNDRLTDAHIVPTVPKIDSFEL